MVNPPPETPGRHVARNIAGARNELGLDQKQLAARMRALGWKWVRQTVGEAENGRRRLTTDEIVGLSIALETTIATLLSPPDRAVGVGLPSGGWVSAELVRASIRGDMSASFRWGVRWKEDEPLFPPLELPEGVPMGWYRRGPADEEE